MFTTSTTQDIAIAQPVRGLLGGDSLAMLNLQFQVEKVLGISIPPEVLYENPTFGAFAGVVHAVSATKAAMNKGKPRSLNGRLVGMAADYTLG